MQQMNIPEEQRVDIDLTREEWSRPIRTLLPVVFRRGGTFYSLLGPSMEGGILGKGQSVEEALAVWEEELRRRIMNSDENDEVATYAKDALGTHKKDVW